MRQVKLAHDLEARKRPTRPRKQMSFRQCSGANQAAQTRTFSPFALPFFLIFYGTCCGPTTALTAAPRCFFWFPPVFLFSLFVSGSLFYPFPLPFFSFFSIPPRFPRYGCYNTSRRLDRGGGRRPLANHRSASSPYRLARPPRPPTTRHLLAIISSFPALHHLNRFCRLSYSCILLPPLTTSPYLFLSPPIIQSPLNRMTTFPIPP